MNGRFSIPLPDDCTTKVGSNAQVWVEVLVGPMANTVASLGRAKLGAVPYAVEADHAVSASSAATAATANAAGGSLASTITALQARLGPPSAFHAHASLNQMIPSGPNTRLNFDTVDFDLSSEFDGPTGVFRPKVDGYYILQCRLRFQQSGVIANWDAVIEVNGIEGPDTNSRGDGASADRSTSTIMHLKGGDEVTCNASQDSGSAVLAVPSSDGKQTAFEAARLAL